VTRETVQGEREQQLGAALRCVASVHTRAHGHLLFVGGAKDVLLVVAVGAADEGAETCDAGRRRMRLLCTHRVPAARGVMLRFMALAALEVMQLMPSYPHPAPALDGVMEGVLEAHVCDRCLCHDWRLACGHATALHACRVLHAC